MSKLDELREYYDNTDLSAAPRDGRQGRPGQCR